MGLLSLGVAFGSLLTGCGSADSHKSARACPDDCPAEQCEQDTGTCLPASTEPSGGAPNAAEDASGGTPSGGTPSQGTPSAGAPSAGAPNEPTELDTTAPIVTLTAPAEGAVVEPSVTFEFTADEPANFTCTLNDEPVDDCQPGITLDELTSGENTFGVKATDAAGNESEVALVTFIVNRGPSIGELADIVTPEDTSTGDIPFMVDDPDTLPEALSVSGTLDSGRPIPEGGLILSGTGSNRRLSLTPAANAFGSAVLTLSVSDGFVTATKDVNVTVTPINDPPTIEDVSDKRVDEHAVLGPVTVHVSDLETPANDLLLTATSSDVSKVPRANIVLGGSGESRTFTITPIDQQTGPVTITLMVSDGQLTASDSFVLTLGSTDDEPTLSAIADQTTPEDTAKTVAFTVGDPDTNVNALVPSASFAASGIVQGVTFGGSGASRTFTITPKANQTGTAPVSITISDASGGVSRSFLLTVTPVNDAPTITAPANQSLNEDTSTGALAFTVGDVDSGTLTVSAASSNTALIPNANIALAPASGPPGSRSVNVTPVPGMNGGPVTITLTVSDGALTAKVTFSVTVLPVNDPPLISDVTDHTLEPDTSTGSIAFTVRDPDGDTPLSVTAQSSDLRVVPATNVSLGGSGNDRNVSILPAANQGGKSTITLTVSDGHGGTATDTFVVSVKVKLTGAVMGSGSVLASGSGCPGRSAVCAALPGPGAVTFVATPAAGATFVNWTGACTNGVVTPIPTAGVTCTANFRNLWARLFYTPDDVQTQLVSAAHGVVETGQLLHYLGSEPSRTTTTAVVWSADPLTGAGSANSAFEITQDGSPLTPIDLIADPSDANGTVALVDHNVGSGSGLLWFDQTNQLIRATSYATGMNGIENVPRAVVRSKAGGITFAETTHNTSPVAVFPTLAQLTRVDGVGNVLGGTSFSEAVGDCAQPTVSQSYTPLGLGVNADGSYLVAGAVGAGSVNLTLFNSAGVPAWGRHVAPTAERSMIPVAVTTNGDSFLVTGAISDAQRSLDAFLLSITKTGRLNWWVSFGDDGLLDAAFHGVASGNDFVITGYSSQQAGTDMFALKLKADGSLATGLLYGGAGTEQGIFIANAGNGGYDLFGNSTGSFGNLAASAWALRVDQNLQITLQTGAVTAYEPTLVAELGPITATCIVPDVSYFIVSPAFHTLNASASPLSVGGPYQAIP